MREDTSKQKAKASVKQEQAVELGLPLEELVRRGARDILRQAIEVEVQTVLDEYADVQLLDGRQAVVRNGYLPKRELLTGIGPVEVQVPKIPRPLRCWDQVHLCAGPAVCAAHPASVRRVTLAVPIPLPTTFPDAALNLEREDEIRDAL
jgi:hypothetical protein